MKAIVQRRYGTVGRRGLASLPRFAGLIARTPFTKQLPPLDFATPGKPASMAELTELIEAGKLTPHVGRTFARAGPRGAPPPGERPGRRQDHSYCHGMVDRDASVAGVSTHEC